MSEMTLTRNQIEKLHQIYKHFHEIKEFTITVESDDMINVRFDISDIPPEVKSKGKQKKDFIPEVFK